MVESVTVDGDKENEAFLVYNNRKNPLVHIVGENGGNWLLSTVPQLDAEYEYSSSPFVKREKLTEPLWVNGEYRDSIFALSDGLLQFDGLKVRMVDSDVWQDNLYVHPADSVLLCRGFLGRVDELVEAYPSSCLLLDASLYKRSRERILRECTALGIEAIDISESGAMMVAPSGDKFTLLPLRGK